MHVHTDYVILWADPVVKTPARLFSQQKGLVKNNLHHLPQEVVPGVCGTSRHYRPGEYIKRFLFTMLVTQRGT